MQYIVQPLLKNSFVFPGNTPDRVYSISAINSGLVVSAISASPTQQVEQRAWKEETAQQFRFEKLDDGCYKMVCVASGHVLSVNGGFRDDDATIIPWPWEGADHQRWRLVYLSASVFRIEAKHSGKVLTVAGAQGTAGAKLVQSGSNGDTSQQFRISELVDNKLAGHLGNRIAIYTGNSYTGKVQLLGPGSYDFKDLAIGQDYLSAQATGQKVPGCSVLTGLLVSDDKIASLKIPSGMRVTLYSEAGFRGDSASFTEDTDWVGEALKRPLSILVDVAATAYEEVNYQGRSISFGVGSYDLSQNYENDRISSIRVPVGMQVELYSDGKYQGASVVASSNIPNLTTFDNRVTSLIVKMTGTNFPENALCFGDQITLRSLQGRVVLLSSDGRLASRPETDIDTLRQVDARVVQLTQFTVLRAGTTTTEKYVCYGDVIALRGQNGKYVRMTGGQTLVDADTPVDAARLVVVRAGEADSRSFVNKGATIAIRHAAGNNSINDGATSGYSWFDRPFSQAEAQIFSFTIAELVDNTPEDAAAAEAEAEAEGGLCGAQGALVDACGAQICATDACGAQGFLVTACGADVCGTAVCGAQAALVNACGAAASAVVLCVADVGGVIFCGAEANRLSACGGNACGVAGCAAAACGADLCGGAACAIAVCGAAACGAAACGGNACATEACPGDLCGANACGGNACALAIAPNGCPIDACGANACAIDLCPIDACAADACAIDIIPIIPGI